MYHPTLKCIDGSQLTLRPRRPIPPPEFVFGKWGVGDQVIENREFKEVVGRFINQPNNNQTDRPQDYIFTKVGQPRAGIKINETQTIKFS